MYMYRVRYLDENKVNCISMFKAKNSSDAKDIAFRDYGAIKILECNTI